jgi:hypothetical protein
MKNLEVYRDLRGRIISLADLDHAERTLFTFLVRTASKNPSWNEFRNEWRRRVHDFYANRGLSRPEIMKTVAYRVGRDLSSRLAIAEGSAAPPDYRDDLEELIETKFRTRRAFCKATGLSEDMLSHVLSRRKHLSIEALTAALGRVGYCLHIAEQNSTADIGTS